LESVFKITSAAKEKECAAQAKRETPGGGEGEKKFCTGWGIGTAEGDNACGNSQQQQKERKETKIASSKRFYKL